ARAPGAQLWVSRYAGPGAEAEDPFAIAAGPDGKKVFVTGETHTSATNVDYATVAYVDRPELPGPVGQAARDQAQAVSEQLAEAGDHADRERPRSQEGQVGTDDRSGALVGEVREEAHRADQQHELQRGGS